MDYVWSVNNGTTERMMRLFKTRESARAYALELMRSRYGAEYSLNSVSLGNVHESYYINAEHKASALLSIANGFDDTLVQIEVYKTALN